MLVSLRAHFAGAVLVVVALAVACGGGSSSPAATVSPRASATLALTATPRATLLPATASPARASPTPAPSGSAKVIGRGDASGMVVALTFDAGADVGYASQILDTLRANGVAASFGMTGQWAERYPQLLARMVNEGHLLINHTYDHQSFTGHSTDKPPLAQADRWAELDRTEAIIEQLTGKSTLPYFRPPYGDYNDSVNADVYARGYRYNIMWTVDSFGWRGLSADQIVQRCLSMAEAGAIYIFHVGSQSQDGPALQRVIDGLRSMGYGFVPVSAFAPR